MHNPSYSDNESWSDIALTDRVFTIYSHTKMDTEEPKNSELLLHASSNGHSPVKKVEEQPRESWKNKIEFILACIGYAVGLGNMWRFPYLCYRSGGGAFLIPYVIMLFLCGIPLLFMELAVGQYTRRGPIGAMEKLCPILKGAGVATVVISFLLATYYNVIIAWVMYYLVSSFSAELPWSNCSNKTWSTEKCWDASQNGSAPNNSVPSTQEFFDRGLLEMTSGIEDMGGMRWELFGYLCLAWVLVYFCLWKGIKSSGKVVYVTATLPYLLIGAFLWRALTLEGSDIGLAYFFQPKWEQLLEAKVWVNAAAQNFNSIGIGFGSLIAFASYNPFNGGIMRDTLIISLVDAGTCILAGMCVFAILGNLAFEQGKTIDEVVSNGPGLVFVAYPQALAKMPGATAWAIIFFAMLLCLGIDSQFATVEVIITSLKDGYYKPIQKYLKRHELVVLAVCILCFICGIPSVMQGGVYYFQLIDYYAAAISLMYIAFFEVVGVVWIYGAGRLASNVKDMTGSLPNLYIRICWWVLAPCLITAIWIFSMVDYSEPIYNNVSEGVVYVFPRWAIAMGWIIASLSLGVIPAFAVIQFIKTPGDTFLEKLKGTFRSQIDSCPCCEKGLDGNHEAHNLQQLSL